MKLSTGKIAFPIEFDNGDRDCIYFNPNDPDLIERFKNFSKRSQERIEELPDIRLGNDGQPLQDTDGDVFKKMREIMCEELDTAFGSDVSHVIFKHCSPFAVVNGEFFVVQFLNAIKPEIEKQIAKTRGESEKKMKKYVEQYKK